MCTGSGNPVYGDKKEMKEHMHGPIGATPGELAARSLSLCAHMYLPRITGVFEPDYRALVNSSNWTGLDCRALGDALVTHRTRLERWVRRKKVAK
jgi:hypothetical protein